MWWGIGRWSVVGDRKVRGEVGDREGWSSGAGSGVGLGDKEGGDGGEVGTGKGVRWGQGRG